MNFERSPFFIPCEPRKVRSVRSVSFEPRFPFWHPEPRQYTPTGSFPTAISHFSRQRAVWQPGVRLQDGVNRHPDPFPNRFLGQLAISSARFPRFSPAGCGPYPAGKGSNSIRRSMDPNRRRVSTTLLSSTRRQPLKAAENGHSVNFPLRRRLFLTISLKGPFLLRFTTDLT